MAKETERDPGNSFIAVFGTSFFTAFFIYILEVIFVVAFTALIYSGELSSQIPRALGFILIGDAILCATVAWLSSNPGSIAVEQDAPGAMLSLIAVGMIAALPGDIASQFATVTVMIVTTTLLTGMLLLILGVFKLGGMARFLPYPVMGGFLAGSGWLLVRGGIGIVTDAQTVSEFLQWPAYKLWIPALVLGVLIYAVSRKISKPYTIPAIMLAAAVLFYLISWIANSSVIQLRASGWLLEPYSSVGRWETALNPALFSQVHWDLLFHQFPALISVAIICVIGLLLNSSGMELIIKKDIDLNRELLMAGVGNMAAGMAGGLVGFQDVSFSTLNHVMAGGRRLVGILAAVLIGITLFGGLSAILYIPKFVFGSVLIYLGIELLVEWVYQPWFRFSRVDFLMLLTIMITLVLWGVLEGVVVGLILAVFTFVISYSRVSVIKFALTGREYRSRVTRSPDEQQLLDFHGDELFLMKLEGFVFFGTANGIFERLREYVKSVPLGSVKYALLDFSKVTGIDSTGMLSFSRMMQWSQEQEITLVMVGLADGMQNQFTQENTSQREAGIKFFHDADHGIEWCENEIIAANMGIVNNEAGILEQLRAILIDDNLEKLIPYLECRTYQAGEYMIREGESADSIYFIQSGQVTAQLEAVGRNPVRLETIRSGRTVGEIAFFLGSRRTASVVADRDSVVYQLSLEDLEKMDARDPEAANVFHRLSAILLSHRVTHLTATVRALERT